MISKGNVTLCLAFPWEGASMMCWRCIMLCTSLVLQCPTKTWKLGSGTSRPRFDFEAKLRTTA